MVDIEFLDVRSKTKYADWERVPAIPRAGEYVRVLGKWRKVIQVYWRGAYDVTVWTQYAADNAWPRPEEAELTRGTE